MYKTRSNCTSPYIWLLSLSISEPLLAENIKKRKSPFKRVNLARVNQCQTGNYDVNQIRKINCFYDSPAFITVLIKALQHTPCRGQLNSIQKIVFYFQCNIFIYHAQNLGMLPSYCLNQSTFLKIYRVPRTPCIYCPNYYVTSHTYLDFC